MQHFSPTIYQNREEFRQEQLLGSSDPMKAGALLFLGAIFLAAASPNAQDNDDPDVVSGTWRPVLLTDLPFIAGHQVRLRAQPDIGGKVLEIDERLHFLHVRGHEWHDVEGLDVYDTGELPIHMPPPHVTGTQAPVEAGMDGPLVQILRPLRALFDPAAFADAPDAAVAPADAFGAVVPLHDVIGDAGLPQLGQIMPPAGPAAAQASDDDAPGIRVEQRIFTLQDTTAASTLAVHQSESNLKVWCLGGFRFNLACQCASRASRASGSA